MGFTELNSVEHYIIHQLSGVNLNTKQVQEPQKSLSAKWQFQTSDQSPKPLWPRVRLCAVPRSCG